MPDLQCIDFHGHDLYSLRDDQTGKEYVLPKRFCEIFQISWPGQHAKLTKNQLFRQGVKKILIPSAQGGEQETVVLELALLHAWLLSISPERVAQNLRETLLGYQKDCAKALHDYWSKGVAVQASALDRFPELRAIVELAQSTAEARLLAEEAKAEAEQAKIEAIQAQANATRALESQLFFTVAEYICFNTLERQVPTSSYKACSDHLRLYCLDHNIPFRKIPVGGKRWEEEYGFHVSVYAEAFTKWIKRRDAQISVLPRKEKGEQV